MKAELRETEWLQALALAFQKNAAGGEVGTLHRKQKGKLQPMAVGGLGEGESSSCLPGGCSPGLEVGLKPSLT